MPVPPVVRDHLKVSSSSGEPGTPGVSWVNSCPPVVVSPPAEPYSTLTAPAAPKALTFSPGAPAAKSAKPSWLKSPNASAQPKRSPRSTVPPTWVNSWLPVPQPLAVPYMTVTAPASEKLPMASRGADGQVGEAVLVEVSPHLRRLLSCGQLAGLGYARVAAIATAANSSKRTRRVPRRIMIISLAGSYMPDRQDKCSR